MLCLMCGQDNSDELTTCPNCQAPMPKKNTSISSAPPQKIYERYNAIKEEADKALNGEITPEELAAFLNRTKDILSVKEKEIQEIEIPQEFYDDFVEEMNTGFHGIALFKEGIDVMLAYTRSGNTEVLNQGLDLILRGNEAINDARMINRESRRQMEEMYLDATSFM